MRQPLLFYLPSCCICPFTTGISLIFITNVFSWYCTMFDTFSRMLLNVPRYLLHFLFMFPISVRRNTWCASYVFCILLLLWVYLHNDRWQESSVFDSCNLMFWLILNLFCSYVFRDFRLVHYFLPSFYL